MRVAHLPTEWNVQCTVLTVVILRTRWLEDEKAVE
jgi:hypothetical protein